MQVRAKKHLGQHFLKDLEIAKNIATSLENNELPVLEVGPGMGVLTNFLNAENKGDVYVAEIDRDSVAYLIEKGIVPQERILGDFLHLDLKESFDGEVNIIGNFPYNISSQILFRTLENKELIPEFAGMFQKEVAERIVAKPGNKQFGILSVMTQAYYDAEYLFTVDEHVFDPPPRVKSAVIHLKRKENTVLDCDEKLFKTIVKTTFNTRRKMLRGSLRRIVGKSDVLHDEFFQKRPEQLSVEDFVNVTNIMRKAIDEGAKA
ncbi:MAG: 16S rRNA (adenine(1518)-N(6)/adenine(1519)-N(6))-dimethyltransferase [Bacteroidetes bacterium 4572_112]|nr:MAG: 16S rRNA (adenine(1518)-N(6)/adenine(1519)-N(6))-dimethyltransferase [Bacteroidetes bacterium 4572_112]